MVIKVQQFWKHYIFEVAQMRNLEDSIFVGA